MEAVMYNYHTWIDYRKEEVLMYDFENMLLKSGFTIIKKVDHFFEGQGYTGIWLLAESHFAIHTFPESGKVYIEISSCVKKYFDEFLRRFNSYNI